MISARRTSTHRHSRRGIGASPRSALASAISVVCGAWLVVGNFSAEAGDILRGGSAAGAKPTSNAAGGVTSAAAAQATANARDALARTTRAVHSVNALQSAARDIARRSANNLGLDPNHAGRQLPNVPNGLAIGGLQVAPGVPKDLKNPAPGEDAKLWRGATLPTQKQSGGRTNVDITQFESQAVLTWKTFNIGRETTLNFIQSKGTTSDGGNSWIAFNRVLDPSGSPSQILGSIRADGAVYVINQNGIIFGGSSQINLHTLVASSLPINDNLIARGLLNNPDSQFLFSSLPLAAGANGTPAFTPAVPLTPSGRPGDVTVQAGAQITAPTTAAHVGGRVALIGPNVTNDGTISTPDGQTILAAGLQVGFGAHASSDASLRGLDVFVGAIVPPPPAPQQGQPPPAPEKPYAGTATNSGLIDAPRANVTMAGKSVNQNGVIDSSTSVSLNGRVDLIANYDATPYPQKSTDQGVVHAPFLFQSTGTVTLGPSSSTTILPELKSDETVVGTQLALGSQVNIQGRAIHLAADSTLFAPSAAVTLSAGVWKYTGGNIPLDPFVYSTGQIYLEPGALINVAGTTGVPVPVTQNILSVELRGAELADSPLQRHDRFRGSTIQIDIRESGVFNGKTWIGTPLADATGYVGLIKRTVSELTIAGGSVKMNAGSSVVLQRGSKVDVSGGFIDYQPGMVQTTRLVQGARLLDISQATPDQLYDGVYTGTFTQSSAKYGITETFTNPLALTGARWDPGYAFGASGGTIAITAPAVALDGELLGNTIRGPRQRVVPPATSTLSIGFQAQEPTGPLYQTVSPTPPRVIFQPNISAPAADPFTLDASGDPLPLRVERRTEVSLSPELLTASGFGNLKIDNSDGNIVVPAGMMLNAGPGGSITLDGANIDVQGSILAPGGSVTLSTHDISPAKIAKLVANPDNAKTPSADPNRGNFTLGSEALLSAAGLIVDDRAGARHPGETPFVTNGGSITISTFSADLADGSTIDVSGGVAVSGAGKRTYGNAGSITINSGQAALASVDPVSAGVVGGHLHLGSTLKGFSGARGGALNILAPLIQIGGTPLHEDTLLLSSEFFSEGGFASFNLKGLGALGTGAEDYVPAVFIAPGTQLSPVALSAVAIAGENGTDLVMSPILKPEGYRSPVSLSLGAIGVRDNFTRLPIFRGDLVVSDGVRITTDPLGSVSLSGETATVLGSIFAPGGSISISGGKDSNTVFPDRAQAAQQALATVFIGSQSVLSTAGTTIYSVDPRGLRTGLVLPGGSVSISGNIVAAAGSRIDVSGTSAVLDLAPGYSAANSLVPPVMNGSFHGSLTLPTLVESGAGSITLTGGQMLYSDATLVGRAGGPSAVGGTLTVSSGKFAPIGDATPATPLDVTLTVTQGGLALPVGLGQSPIGQVLFDRKGAALEAQGHITVGSFAGGGFDSVALKGSMKFKGAVDLTTPGSLTIADGGVIFADNAVHLTAPHVTLGTPFHAPFALSESTVPFTQGSAAFNFLPTYGPGSLTVTADLIDIGNLSLQGIGVANFIARNGEIRGDGTLDVAGAITMVAAQIYPPTATTFTIAASDYKVGAETRSGSVTIVGSGSHPLPLSAGGTLNIFGSIINQHGTVRAPLGAINIGWDGSGTAPLDPITGKAVAVTKQLTLASGSITSVSGRNPLTGQGILVPYGINLNGNSWIDPTGTDITALGAPEKTVTLSAGRLIDAAGSLVDLRGGGDLYAYRWVAGIGGSKDILATNTSFAIVPGYSSNFAPFAPFSTNAAAANLGGDPGFVNPTLHAGDQIYLGAGSGLPAGNYTLLPARYALLPGAFLVTPKSGIPGTTITLPDGSSLVSGYRFGSSQSAAPINSLFEIAPSFVVRDRAQYDDFFGNAFLTAGAQKLGQDVPRRPIDAGHLILSATQAMLLKGRVAAQGSIFGRGGLVDISSPVDIVITGSDALGAAGTLSLNAADLNSFGAESLLIGGIRTKGANGTVVSVKTGNLTVDNAGTPLRVPDLILVANQSLTLAPGAEIEQTGLLSGNADTITIGDASKPGSGNGTLLRVSSDPGARTIRLGLSNSTVPTMTIGAGAHISGAGIILDSTYATSLDPSAVLDGTAISFNSGQISLQLDNPGALQPTVGLVLSGAALQSLQSARALSLLSYSSIDIYGNGTVSAGNLALHAGQIRGFNNNGQTAKFVASSITIDNIANAPAAAVIAAPSGTLEFDAATIRIGNRNVAIDQFGLVEMNATSGLIFQGTGGVIAQGAVTITTPVITASQAAVQSLTAGGALVINTPANGVLGSARGGLGATLSLTGASLTENTAINLPSGALKLRATGGDLIVGGKLALGGTAQSFYDLTRFTSGGEVALISDHGSISLTADSSVSVSADPLGGDAGSVTISAPDGSFTLAGSMLGKAGAGGIGGTFSLDVASIQGGNIAPLGASLDTGGFTQSRSVRQRVGDLLIDGTSAARELHFSADSGSITVVGTLDASGKTGGVITLDAHGSITLAGTSVLTVAAQDFSSSGKGGAISIEAGSETNGVIDSGATLDIQDGAKIDLTVASNTAASASLGNFTGTLHLRAPQTSNSTRIRIEQIGGAAHGAIIAGASSIVIEGYKIYTPAGGDIATVQGAVMANGTTFTANTASVLDNLFGAGSALQAVTTYVPGAEIINTAGDLTLGVTNPADWDFSTFRFGSKQVPGVLTLRAAGDIVLLGSLSDGFQSAAYTAKLLDQNAQLPTNAQSWSYRITAGADLGAADFRRTNPLATGGSLNLGRDGGTNISTPFGNNGLTKNAITNHFQVIRTGSGDIEISTSRDVNLLNQFATIYTVGTKVLDATKIKNAGDFDVPILSLLGGQGSLGAVQQSPMYVAQYTLAGGNVSINAGGSIQHLTRNTQGDLVADSEREMPTNWLYRRGYTNPATGAFDAARWGDIASTTWWVDFSNFFQGVGALGGGNVRMTAGVDIANVDAVAPTNARMSKDGASFIELGGGDVTVRAGHDIDGGVYYVERGKGTLSAGNSIRTNATRSPSLTISGQYDAPESWLPTTLFLGKGSFDISARGDVLLGPVANPFLLPGGVNNTFWYKSYFSTYAASDAVNITSLGGSVTLRAAATLGQETDATPLLQAWYQRELLLVDGTNPSASFYQPWLRLNESQVQPFAQVMSLMPPTLRATAFSGNINVVGSLTLFPSPTGTIDLAASGAINGLQPNGRTDGLIVNSTVRAWGTGKINLSDANPASVPSIATPFAYQTLTGTAATPSRTTQDNFLSFIDNLFAETGSTQGAAAVLQTKQALHAPGILHAGDPDQIHLYALNGDVSGLQLFSAKSARITAGRDVSDIALYVQNIDASDVTVVSAGRDIIAYAPNSPLRVASQSTGNALDLGAVTLAGDIQISGPGTLEVLAGRNLDLGIGPNNPDGTGLGITTIGNARNPFLPFEGADIFAGAGIGPSIGLTGSKLDFDAFIDKLGADTVSRYLAELKPKAPTASGAAATDIDAFSEQDRAHIAMQMFYLALRDAGRDHATTGNYDSGFAAIDALFGDSKLTGNITLTSREIKTKNGGNVSLFAPNGGLVVGFDIAGNQALDQGILTESGGNISIFTHDDVTVGTSRIFTLRGGNEIIWSSTGDIAAGASSKTVQSAPPTRVLVDAQTADVKTDLAGLATGGGIGVLATVANVAAGDVDLIAPGGNIDAGDAGIRVSGNLRIAAVQVLNASNIAVGGSSGGVPSTPTVSAPSLGSVTAGNSTAGAANSAASEASKQNQPQQQQKQEEMPSIFSVEVVGYGGGEAPAATSPAPSQAAPNAPGSPDEEEEKRKKKAQQEAAPPAN